MAMRNDMVLIRGAGRLGSAIAHRLRLAGFPVVLTEAARPTLIHRATSFGTAIYESEVTVDGVPGRRAADAEGVRHLLERGFVPVLADPPAAVRETIRPWVLIDAIGLHRNVGTRLTDASIVIGVGPGFLAGQDAHVVVDSRDGHDLGRMVLDGALEGEPAPAPFGTAVPLTLTAATVGRFEPRVGLRQFVREGEPIGQVGGRLVEAPTSGIISGLLAEGHFVGMGMRLAEVDPRADVALIDRIDPRARAVAGGVLEAILYVAAVGSAPGQALGFEAAGDGAPAAE